MYFIHLYDTVEEHNEAHSYASPDYGKPWLGLTHGKRDISYNLPKVDWSKEYLTFVALENGTFKFSGRTVDYSLDGGETWTTLASDTNTPTVNAGDKISFRTTGTSASNSGIGRFSSTGMFSAMGNAYSIGYGDDFSGVTTMVSNKSLRDLFSGCTKLVSAQYLSLPATTLYMSCYQSMFCYCSSLKSAPLVLPAETLASQCYYNMFLGCSSLTTAPKLPATSVSAHSYYGMFRNCSSLTIAPSLPATTIGTQCYSSMFTNCTSLTTAPSILPAMTLAIGCYDSMFRGCSALTTAPELPASTLVNGCYKNMFQGCSKLNYIKALFNTAPSSSYMDLWTYLTSSSGTIVLSSILTWNPSNYRGDSGIPTGWTIENASS